MAKGLVRAGAHPSNTSVEGKIVSVVTDEQITDPNSPLAVQTPEGGVGGDVNPLDALTYKSSNEQSEGENTPVYVNPLTGETVTGPDANPTELSPTSDAVATPDSVEDVVATEQPDEYEADPEPVDPPEEPPVIEAADPDAEVDPVTTGENPNVESVEPELSEAAEADVPATEPVPADTAESVSSDEPAPSS